jgi:ABC-type antimicrobial peptide transport system permease subunit
MGLFIYAIIVTVIAVIAGLLIARSLAKLKAAEAPKSK